MERRWDLASRSEEVARALQELDPWLEATGVTGRVRIVCAAGVREALENALVHGSRRDPSKLIRLVARPSERGVEFVVEGEGRGFDHARMTRYIDELERTGTAMAGRPGGRQDQIGGLGILLKRRSFDGVTYEAGGRRIVLTKVLRRSDDG